MKVLVNLREFVRNYRLYTSGQPSFFMALHQRLLVHQNILAWCETRGAFEVYIYAGTQINV